MRVLGSGESKPGCSWVVLDKVEFAKLESMVPRQDVRAFLGRPLGGFRNLCRESQLGSELASASNRQRRAAASCIECCMEVRSSLLENDDVRLSVVVKPGCDGAGETIQRPEQFMIEGYVEQIATLLADG